MKQFRPLILNPLEELVSLHSSLLVSLGLSTCPGGQQKVEETPVLLVKDHGVILGRRSLDEVGEIALVEGLDAGFLRKI